MDPSMLLFYKIEQRHRKACFSLPTVTAIFRIPKIKGQESDKWKFQKKKDSYWEM